MTKKSNRTNPNPINRRQALTGAGAAAGAMALAGPVLANIAAPHTLILKGPSLSALVQRFYAQVDYDIGYPVTDEESDAYAAATYRATETRMIGVPARTAEDALAALDYMERCDLIQSYCGEHEDLVPSLVKAIRGYIEHGVQV